MNTLKIPALIKTFEQDVIKPDVDVIGLLTSTLRQLFSAGLEQGGLSPHMSASDVDRYYTRLSAAITHALIQLPDLNLEQVKQLSNHRSIIQSVFLASGYRSTSHLIDLVSERDAEGNNVLKKQKLLLLFSVLSLDEYSDQLISILLQQEPELIFTIMISLLGQRAVLTEQGERNRTRLLTSGHLIEEVAVDPGNIQSMVKVWMYCSYASTPDKHEIKHTLNRLFVRMMQEEGVNPRPVQKKKRKRPRVMVIHERFTCQHAMFRCYAPLIRSLKSDFELWALADKDQIDESSDSIFDKVYTLEKGMPIDSIVKQIQNLAPDIIYYPSLGMSHYTILIANLRLAPLQIAGQGHPATTHIKTIDHILMPKFEGDLKSLYSEDIMMWNDGVLFEAHSSLPVTMPEKNNIDIGCINIAINSKVLKLSYRLIAICKRLVKESNAPLCFHFFPGEQGVYLDGLKALINKSIPDARVYGYMPYQDFLQKIKNCDLSLAAFPFGNTNSTVDTCLLGVPTVAYLGSEISSQTDKYVINLAGMPEDLITKNDEEYFSKALYAISLIRKDGVFWEGNDNEGVRERIISSGNSEPKKDFLNKFSKIVQLND